MDRSGLSMGPSFFGWCSVLFTPDIFSMQISERNSCLCLPGSNSAGLAEETSWSMTAAERGDAATPPPAASEPSAPVAILSVSRRVMSVAPCRAGVVVLRRAFILVSSGFAVGCTLVRR